MLRSEVANLAGLFVDEILGVGEVLVDEFLVLKVGEWDEVSKGREEES